MLALLVVAVTGSYRIYLGRVHDGERLYLSTCAECHGVDVRGGRRGPDLTSPTLTHVDGYADMYRVISNGIPGTDMTPQNLSRLERLEIAAYLRSRKTAANAETEGDVAAGKRLFDETGCGVCHAVGGVGGAIGPDVSRVGATRGVEYLRQKIRDPNADIMPQYEFVTVVRRDHRAISGIRLNEDTFSIQLMDVGEALHMYLKSELIEIRYEDRSLMPAYGTDVLDEKGLTDVIAFLASLKG